MNNHEVTTMMNIHEPSRSGSLQSLAHPGLYMDTERICSSCKLRGIISEWLLDGMITCRTVLCHTIKHRK
jgi:hypothetical protein